MLTGSGLCYECYCKILDGWKMNISRRSSSVLISPNNLKMRKHEKWSVISCATFSCPPPVSLSPNPSYFPHVSPALSVCVRQLSGLLPVKLHERTGGRTFLLNIALHSGDSLPCLSLPLPALCFVHSCTVASNSRRGLHFYPRHSSPYLLLFFVGESQSGCCVFVLKCSEPCVILHLVA